LSLIASHAGGEACVCDLTDAFELTGPTISHHLKVLREAGVIDGDRRGTWIYYRVRPETLSALSAVLVAPHSISTDDAVNSTNPTAWPSSHRSRSEVQSPGTTPELLTGSRELTG